MYEKVTICIYYVGLAWAQKGCKKIIVRLNLSCLSSANPSSAVLLTALSAATSHGFLRWNFFSLRSGLLSVPSGI